MYVKITGINRIEEITYHYKNELEDSASAYICECGDARYNDEENIVEIEESAFEWWKDWFNAMESAQDHYIHLLCNVGLYRDDPYAPDWVEIPEQYRANDIEDQPRCLEVLCIDIEDGILELEFSEEHGCEWVEKTQKQPQKNGGKE